MRRCVTTCHIPPQLVRLRLVSVSCGQFHPPSTVDRKETAMLTKEMVRLDLPHIVTSLPGPRATELIRRYYEVLSPSYTRCYPLVAARGEGAMIEDVDGNRFLDFNAGIAVTSTGHCHPKVVQAIEEQSKRLIHLSGTD